MAMADSGSRWHTPYKFSDADRGSLGSELENNGFAGLLAISETAVWLAGTLGIRQSVGRVSVSVHSPLSLVVLNGHPTKTPTKNTGNGPDFPFSVGPRLQPRRQRHKHTGVNHLVGGIGAHVLYD